MKKVLLITRNWPEHFELISSLMDTDSLSGIIMITEKLPRQTGEVFENFYKHKKESRTKFFGNRYDNITNINTLTLNSFNEINSDSTYEFIKEVNPDLTIIFDVINISNTTLSKIPGVKWKIHEGYVQKYKGVNGNFHACINHESELVTYSIIEYNEISDMGKIIHEAETKFRKEDTITDRNYRALRKLTFDLVPIMEKFNNNSIKYFDNTPSKEYSTEDLTENLIKEAFKGDCLAINFESQNTNNKFIKQI